MCHTMTKTRDNGLREAGVTDTAGETQRQQRQPIIRRRRRRRRARFHGGDLPGLSHAADKETGTRLRRRAAAAERRVVFFFPIGGETIVKFIFVSLSRDSGEQREAAATSART